MPVERGLCDARSIDHLIDAHVANPSPGEEVVGGVQDALACRRRDTLIGPGGVGHKLRLSRDRPVCCGDGRF